MWSNSKHRNEHHRVTVEICAADIDSVAAAAAAGADRVELCSGLAEGGVTPSAALIAESLNYAPMKVHVLIRPRPGDFVYSPHEQKIIIADIENVRRLGAHGVVIGALTAEGDIDVPFCRKQIEAAGDMNITFHRAFDLCRNPLQAVEDIIALGCTALLTSGTAPTALQGIDMLRKLVDKASGRIGIIAAAGISSANAAEIITHTGVGQIHASARKPQQSVMRYRHNGVSMGADSDEYVRLTTSMEEVKNIIKAVSI